MVVDHTCSGQHPGHPPGGSWKAWEVGCLKQAQQSPASSPSSAAVQRPNQPSHSCSVSHPSSPLPQPCQHKLSWPSLLLLHYPQKPFRALYISLTSSELFLKSHHGCFLVLYTCYCETGLTWKVSSVVVLESLPNFGTLVGYCATQAQTCPT